MSKTVYTPPVEGCPECAELTSSKCTIHEESIPALKLPTGSTLSVIIKAIAKKITLFGQKLKDAVYNMSASFDKGIVIGEFSGEGCPTPTELKVPLFLNGKDCFEYDEGEDVINFSVRAVMGVSTFYDAALAEITDQDEIDVLCDLIEASLVRPICCPECAEGSTGIYDGDDVDCGATNLATAGDDLEDILTKVCGLFDSMGLFNVTTTTGGSGSLDLDMDIDGNNFSDSLDILIDRIGCTEDIVGELTTSDGLTFDDATTTLTIDALVSYQTYNILAPNTIAIGVYNFSIDWTACGVTRTQNGTVTVTQS